MRNALLVGVLGGVLVLAGVVGHWARLRAIDDRAFVAAEAIERASGKEYEAGIQAYHAYLSRYPNGARAEEARSKAESELPGRINVREWAKADQAHSAAGYRSYLARFPSGRSSTAAKQALADLAWAGAGREGTARAYRHFIRAHPEDQRRGGAEKRLRQLQNERLLTPAILGAAGQEFARGRPVYLWDPKPERITRGAVAGHSYTVHYYIRNPHVQHRPGMLVPYKVDRMGHGDAVFTFGAAFVNWEEPVGTLTVNTSAADNFLSSAVAPSRPKHGKTRWVALEVSAVDQTNGALMIQPDQPLSNTVLIPVSD